MAKESAVPASTTENTAESDFYEVVYNGKRSYVLTRYPSYCVVEMSLKGG